MLAREKRELQYDVVFLFNGGKNRVVFLRKEVEIASQGELWLHEQRKVANRRHSLISFAVFVENKIFLTRPIRASQTYEIIGDYRRVDSIGF